MADRLFKRAVQLTVSKPTGFFQDGNNAVVIRDLRVTFSIEKNLKKEPNTCKISVYNLAPPSRALMQTKPLRILLEAGYDGQVKRIFSGDLRYSESTHTSVSWETAMQWADGDRAYRLARVARSFRPGVSSLAMISECASAMGIALPSDLAERSELKTVAQGGEVLQGKAQEELTRVLKRYGLHWSIQDGRLQVLRDGEVRPDVALPVSQATGLIGNIAYGAPTKPGHPRLLKFKSLLYPEIVPGVKVQVTTGGSGIDGIYRVERVVHSGDTHGEQWQSEVEAIAPGAGKNGNLGWVRNAE